MADDTALFIPFKLSKSETAQGTKLICNAMFTGHRYWLLKLNSLFSGLSLGISSYAIPFFALRFFGYNPYSFPIAFLFGVMAFVVVVILIRRALYARELAIVDSNLGLAGREMQISPAGIAFRFGQSHTFWSFSDIPQPIESADMVVFPSGNVGVIIPDRLLAPLGDPVKVRRDMLNWYKAAQNND